MMSISLEQCVSSNEAFGIFRHGFVLVLTGRVWHLWEGSRVVSTFPSFTRSFRDKYETIDIVMMIHLFHGAFRNPALNEYESSKLSRSSAPCC